MRRSITLVLLLTVALAGPCAAGDVPSVVADVGVVGAVKLYNYALTNDLDSGELIYTFILLMPEFGARAVTGFTCSKAGWYQDASFRGDYSMWAMAGIQGTLVQPGETVVFTLTTPAYVPTGFGYIVPGRAGNWAWYAHPPGGGLSSGGDVGYSLPVPVPEPTSLASLGIGSGLALLRLRRKRR
jgi:hypothetical protein